jgi:hypothetical protein
MVQGQGWGQDVGLGWSVPQWLVLNTFYDFYYSMYCEHVHVHAYMPTHAWAKLGLQFCFRCFL